jgi:transcriptional regulator with XRE-family HTH domain
MTIIENNIGTQDWEAYIGEQFRAMRIRADLEQVDLARRAEVSVGAVKNLEGGKGSTIKTLVKVCRALGRTDWLHSLAPAVTVSPMQMLRSRNKAPVRQKVYRPRAPRKQV